MTGRIQALLLALAAPLLLLGCVLTPGKFVSTLDIRADRSFTFTYVGEVHAIDVGDEFAKGMKDAGKVDKGGSGGTDDDGDPLDDSSLELTNISYQASGKSDGDAAKDAKYRAMADALRKEAGYRSVEYKGKGLFLIDYVITGKLTYNFVYPYNVDAEIIFPFVVVELRGKDSVRVKAPGFADGGTDKSGMGGAMAGMGAGMGGDKKATAKLDGSFTLTTNAEIVSQNNEDGSVADPAGRRITWRATPLTKDAPTAVLKVAPLG